MFRFEPEDFLRSLQETMEWTNAHCDTSDPQSGFRSALICPNPLQSSLEGKHAYEYVVLSVVEKRSRALGYDWKSRSDLATGLQDGRLLCFEPDGTLFDGAAEVASQGFFDVYNVPPWDTWVVYFQDSSVHSGGYLVCWVPRRLIDLVSMGVQVNPEECIWWLDEKKSQLSESLKSEGFIF